MSRGLVIGYTALGAVCAAGIIAWLVMQPPGQEGSAAEIYVGGELVRRAELSEDAVFTVETPYGSNVVEISGGAVRVTEADCPDKVCVRTGAVSGGVVPIVCLPHRLEIYVTGAGGGADAAAG